MVVVIAQTSQCDDRIYDRRKDRADAVALLEVVDHPLFAYLEGFFAGRSPPLPLEQLERVVGRVEYRSPEAAPRRHIHRLVQQKLPDVELLRHGAIGLAR